MIGAVDDFDFGLRREIVPIYGRECVGGLQGKSSGGRGPGDDDDVRSIQFGV